MARSAWARRLGATVLLLSGFACTEAPGVVASPSLGPAAPGAGAPPGEAAFDVETARKRAGPHEEMTIRLRPTTTAGLAQIDFEPSGMQFHVHADHIEFPGTILHLQAMATKRVRIVTATGVVPRVVDALQVDLAKEKIAVTDVLFDEKAGVVQDPFTDPDVLRALNSGMAPPLE